MNTLSGAYSQQSIYANPYLPFGLPSVNGLSDATPQDSLDWSDEDGEDDGNVNPLLGSIADWSCPDTLLDPHHQGSNQPSTAAGAASSQDAADSAGTTAQNAIKVIRGQSSIFDALTGMKGAVDQQAAEHEIAEDEPAAQAPPAEPTPEAGPPADPTPEDAKPTPEGPKPESEDGDDTEALAGLDKALGPAAVVAGGYGVYSGIKQLTQGQLAAGASTLTGGVATTGAGAATTATGFSLVSDAAMASKFATGAGVLGGVGAVASGGFGIYQGIKSHNTSEIANGGVQTAAGGLMIAGAMTGDPFMAGAGALLYGGDVAWQNRKAIGHFAEQSAKDVGHAAVTAGKAVGHAYTAANNAVNHAVGSAEHAVGSAAKATGHAIVSGTKTVAHDLNPLNW